MLSLSSVYKFHVSFIQPLAMVNEVARFLMFGFYPCGLCCILSVLFVSFSSELFKLTENVFWYTALNLKFSTNLHLAWPFN